MTTKPTEVQYLAPLPWSIDMNSIDRHWKNSVSIVDAEGGEVAVLLRGYEDDKNGDPCPSFANAKKIVDSVNRQLGS